MGLARTRIGIVMVAAVAAGLGTTVAPASASTRTAAVTGSIHGQATNVNACMTTITPPVEPPSASTLKVSISSDASPAPHHGAPITLSNTQVAIVTPSDFLVQAYDAGLLTNGQRIPATLALAVAGSNTTESSHMYPLVRASPTVTIHDPDGIPGSGDETADPLRFARPLPDTVWNPTHSARRVHFTEMSAVVALTVLAGGTPFVSTQTCGVTNPRPFVVVDGR
jgi:hypothetical protein